MSSTSTAGPKPAGAGAKSVPVAAPGALAPDVNLPESLSYRVKKRLLGQPLVNDQLHGEKLSNPVALGVLAPDCVSSSAYGTEQMLTQLVPYFGTVGFMLVMPVTGVILGLLLLLTLCYRDVVRHYTKAGGAYVVARENFGQKVAQIAAVALLIDYIVTVAVQIAAGTDAIASWMTFTFHVNIDSWKIYISVFVIILLCFGNLRGIREAGRSFAVPAYFYILMAGTTVLLGLIKLATTGLPQAVSLHDQAGGALRLGGYTGTLFQFTAILWILKGFANGGSSLTGLEAISNGVSVFKKPAGKNAAKTMIFMSTALGSLVLGISILAWQLKTNPYGSGNPTVLAQITKITWGGHGFGTVMLTLVQLSTALILYTGGNTSFNGFPFLTSFVAEDNFLPRQFLVRGHRLSFSNGIIVLTILSLALLIGTGGDLTSLVALYAIGVFTGFVMASAGLFKYHWSRNEPYRWWKLFVAGSACVMSFAVVVIFATVKFTEGAWMVVIVFPPAVFGLIQLNKRYRREAEALAKAPASADLPMRTQTSILVLVDSVDLAVIKTLRYARSLRPTEVRAVHLMVDNLYAEQLRGQWDASQAADIPLEIIEVPDRRIRRAAMELAARETSDGYEVTVLLPRRTYSPVVGRLLHDRTADRLAEVLSTLPHVVATIVPFDVVEAIEELELAEKGRKSKVRESEAGSGAGKPRSTKKMLLDAECGAVPDPGRGVPVSVSPISTVQWRQRAAVQGRVRSVAVSPVKGSPALEAELYDASGGITLVFYGRRSIPGIEPGALMRVEGMVGEMEGHLAMANPTYKLLPREHGDDE
ncbi:amino acid permease [Catenulispora sp. NF23]|uniref:Amino acid permease n=1 Tax=Catenulispora pinistramenti TaxID=2705254 RepID=A0ABS5KLC3_9ACTN|nr:amino acid permease [Catenulispora pinistramenti]MBS2532057.1 amino acid permease [Catenulispora pinistramenti]MBS2546830.1 amino acid permease [Catenulispora pinistramenti]